MGDQSRSKDSLSGISEALGAALCFQPFYGEDQCQGVKSCYLLTINVTSVLSIRIDREDFGTAEMRLAVLLWAATMQVIHNRSMPKWSGAGSGLGVCCADPAVLLQVLEVDGGCWPQSTQTSGHCWGLWDARLCTAAAKDLGNCILSHTRQHFWGS